MAGPAPSSQSSLHAERSMMERGRSSLEVDRSTLDVGRSRRFGRLVVISPEVEDTREQSVLARLFAAGLTSYHLRKPTWTRDQLVAWLGALPAEFHPRIVLHSHHDLAVEFTLGGLHRSSTDIPVCAGSIRTGKNACAALIHSRPVHDLAMLRDSLDTTDRLLVSPIFPSISKLGYGPSAAFSLEELRAALALPRRAEVIALGGIEASRIAACRMLGFDGVAVLGAIWQAADPLAVFQNLQHALHAHAA